jgi:DnaK suppressor protein
MPAQTSVRASVRNRVEKITSGTSAAATRKATTASESKKTVATSPASVASSAGAGSFLSPLPKSAKPMTPVAPKKGLRYSDKDLSTFRTNITKAKEEAVEELRMLRERLEDLTNSESNEDSSIYSMHMAEQGSEAVEKEKTYAQIQRIQDYLRKLDESLLRITEKSYGICRMCGILIAKERLIAVPITTLSASYKIHKKCPSDGTDRIHAKDSLK